MLVDIKLHVKFKLFALWSALMFCYFYGDYFELYQPGKLQEMLSGKWAYGPVTPGLALRPGCAHGSSLSYGLCVPALSCACKPLAEYLLGHRLYTGSDHDAVGLVELLHVLWTH
jgi:hypothetical protein